MIKWLNEWGNESFFLKKTNEGLFSYISDLSVEESSKHCTCKDDNGNVSTSFTLISSFIRIYQGKVVQWNTLLVHLVHFLLHEHDWTRLDELDYRISADCRDDKD